jgi:hypothetical protein
MNYLLADEAHATTNPEMTVEFTHLAVDVRNDAVTLNYEVARDDWRAMRRKSVEPRVNIFTRDARRGAFTYAYSAALESRIGRITYPPTVKLRGTRVVELEVVGYSGIYRVSQTRFGENCGERVRVRVGAATSPNSDRNTHIDRPRREAFDRPNPRTRRDHRPRHLRPHVDVAAIIDACRTYAPHRDTADCIADARAQADIWRAADTVEVCGSSTKWAHDFRDCMKVAQPVRFGAADVIEACERQTDWPHERNACVKEAASWERPGAADVIDACGEATRFDHEFDSCLEESRRVSDPS